MPDYGHALEFGTFITPTNQPHEAPVALGQLSERLGFDLVTYQDHPYQAGFLDTWTLLSWVAAKTDRIRVSGNVLNLPLRQPAVLARSAASLDLLSEGRFDLALGAGAFWDAIEAMGGRRLSPGQGVTALSEAIDIIRGIWDVDERRPLTVDGDFYHVHGAKRGPATTRPIPVLLGAYKPRMLRLVGRKADGWVPSLSYLAPGALRDANDIIDQAAMGAGRRPEEIRRLLNIGGTFSSRRGGLLTGPASQWVDELLPLALDEGTATFILSSDDPRTMQTFADDVMPALREQIAAERKARGTEPAPSRTAVALAKRVPGIDYDAIPENLRPRAVEPGDHGYRSVRSTYIRGGSPGLVLPVHTAEEVVDALAFARQQNVPLALRSGGHGISGRSTNAAGIVIDMKAMNAIEVLDVKTRRVRIGPGALWMNVAAKLSEHGWAISSGDYGGVGVGGLATAGGVGWLVREHGLTIDHLRAADIVLADGTLVHASESENPDLFWALRGAGANFGIVTAFEFEAHDIGEIGWAQTSFDATDTAGFLTRWGAFIEASPRDVTSFATLVARRGQPTIARVMTMVDADDPDTIIDRLRPLAEVAPLVDQTVQLTSYARVMANATEGPHYSQGEPHSRSALVDHVTQEFARDISSMLDTGDVYYFQVRSLGGAVQDVPSTATAYANRTANFSIVAFGRSMERMDAHWESLKAHRTGLYLSFDTDLRPERLAEAFPEGTIARLRNLKRTYDPHNVFRDNFNIQPSAQLA
ncbi:MAG: LLM class flavin-dependent oxidoreductase [Mycetocola sp.]